MDEIFIIDDFLNKKDITILFNTINEKDDLWCFGHSSGYDEIIANKFFSIYNTEPLFVDYLFNKIQTKFKKKFKINRHYMHVQMFGQDGAYHIDDHGSNKYTVCLYLSERDNDEIENGGGEFFVKIPKKKEILSIDTYSNRALIFPSNYLHKGMAFNKKINTRRLCLTWKLEEII